MRHGLFWYPLESILNLFDVDVYCRHFIERGSILRGGQKKAGKTETADGSGPSSAARYMQIRATERSARQRN